MKVKELIERLSGENPEMEVKILSKNHKSGLPATEHIEDARVSKYPCPNICVLIEGV